jgi:hypothetical protein
MNNVGRKSKMKLSLVFDFSHSHDVVRNKATVSVVHFESFFESFCCRSQDFAGSFPKLSMTRGHIIEMELTVAALDAIIAYGPTVGINVGFDGIR